MRWASNALSEANTRLQVGQAHSLPFLSSYSGILDSSIT